MGETKPFKTKPLNINISIYNLYHIKDISIELGDGI